MCRHAGLSPTKELLREHRQIAVQPLRHFLLLAEDRFTNALRVRISAFVLRMSEAGFCEPKSSPVRCRERGNAHAHLRAALLGRSIAVGINHAELMLGRFQSIIFAELDGPRKREISIQVIGE